MKNSIQALRERRNALAKEASDFLNIHNEAWNAAEHAPKYDAMLDEIDGLDSQITRINAVNDRMAKEALDEQLIHAHQKMGGDKKHTAIFAKWIRGGDKAISDTEWADIRATMSTTTGSEGGYTVQTDIAKTIAEALKATGGMRDVATVLQTSMGNSISYPNSNGVSEEGEILGENQTSTDSDPDLGATTIAVYKYGSKVVAVPIELLMDSAIDIEQFVRQRLVSRIARITNKHFTIGSGTGQPMGLVTAAAAGKVGASGQTATITYDDLVDLQHSVNRAYRDLGATFMMSDSALKVIRKLKDGQSRPIFVPGYETGVPGGMPDTLLGDRLVINDDIPAPAANAKSVVYGSLKSYLIRDVMSYNLMRFDDSAYAKKGQVGFLMFSRNGGGLPDVGGAVKYYQNAAS